MSRTVTVSVSTSGGLWYLKDEGKIKQNDVWDWLEKAGDEDPGKTIRGMEQNPNVWFEIKYEEISPIQRLIKKNFPNKEDCRIDFWTRLSEDVRLNNIPLAITKIRSHVSDDDYDQQIKILFNEIEYWDERRPEPWRVRISNQFNDDNVFLDLPASFSAEDVQNKISKIKTFLKLDHKITAARNGFRDFVEA
jgi:hypothetical protein